MELRIHYRYPGKSAQFFKGQNSEKRGDASFFISDFQQKESCVFYGSHYSQHEVLIRPTATQPFHRFAEWEDYRPKVNQFIEALSEGEKAVLAQPFSFSEILDPAQTFEQLDRAYPHALVYLFQVDDGPVWVGATPEVLCYQISGFEYETMALAGTKWDLNKPWTEKEMEEQRIVTDFILSQLNKAGAENIKTAPLSDLQSGSLIHLCNRIRFTFKGDVQSLVQTLHPTPAVSGFPQEKALDLIARNEGFSRMWYSGVIGRSDSKLTSLFVNLRCGQICTDKFISFAGGGITARSNPAQEWEEITRKSRAVLDALA